MGLAGGRRFARRRGRLQTHLSETATTLIASEIERFNRLSAVRWSSASPMRPLHVINSLRLGDIAGRIERHFGWASGAWLTGLRILDWGCGGGLRLEALARLGASALGIDASAANETPARLHAQTEGASVEHRLG